MFDYQSLFSTKLLLISSNLDEFKIIGCLKIELDILEKDCSHLNRTPKQIHPSFHAPSESPTPKFMDVHCEGNDQRSNMQDSEHCINFRVCSSHTLSQVEKNHLMWAQQYIHTLRLSAASPLLTRPVFSVSVHRSSRLSAVAPGELRGPCPTKLPSPG